MPIKTRSFFSRLSFLKFTLPLALLLARSASSAPLGEYHGWLWETGLWGSPGQLSEETCFGNYVINFAGDLTWVTNNTGTIDVCFGRTTTSGGRAFDGVPLSSAPVSEAQSTRPLVSAGGNLYEIYGEDIGDGEGESRFGTLLSVSSDNLMMLGGYETFSEASSFEEFRLIDLIVKSTNAVRNARTAADLAGTSWRVVAKRHEVDLTNMNNELVVSTVRSLDLLADGVCSFTVSDVVPKYSKNGDSSLALQFDFGDSLDDRYVRGGARGATISNCTYTIDANKYLAVSRTRTLDSDPGNPIVETLRFAISDDNRYLVRAPAPTVDDSPRSLSIGYRAASQMAASAIDGTFLFNLAITEFGADGAGAAAAGFGDRSWQEFDGMGRGKMVFDSSNPGTAPDGETGTWYSCDSEMTIHQFEHEWTGSATGGTLALGQDSGPGAANIVFNDCDYRVDANGGLSLYLLFSEPDGGFEAIFRGYVDDSGEVIALTLNQVEEDPQNPGNVNEDLANIVMVLGMKYTGDPDADADGDGLTNLEEFRSPVPPPSGARGDMNGDGLSDILWRNASNGQNWLYQMNGPTIDMSVGLGSVASVWSIVGNGDYNGDGNADILWRHSGTGTNWMYLMNGSTVETSASVNTVASQNWQLVGNGDYNGDGNADILWRNIVSGQNWMYLMNGNAIATSAWVNTIPTNWNIVGSGDYNADGMDDVLLRNSSSGQNYVYFMNGPTIASGASINTVASQNWQVAGTGDYDGDGDADILWRNSVSGQNWMYLMNGSTIAVSGWVNTIPTSWNIVGSGDYNGDGNSDVLLRNSSTGQNWMYLMNGTSIGSSVSVNTVGDQNWQVVNVD